MIIPQRRRNLNKPPEIYAGISTFECFAIENAAEICYNRKCQTNLDIILTGFETCIFISVKIRALFTFPKTGDK